MFSPSQAEIGANHVQVYSDVNTIGQAQRLSLNALKHGLRSAAGLLPGDDPQEFAVLRRDLFETYRPRTGDEAACVEAMASQHWRMARCRRWQAVFDAQTDALLLGDPRVPAGHICERDPHRWMHKSMDCVLQESRLDRLMCRARDKLLLLQKLRRNNLITGALEQEPIFWPEESPLSGPVGHPPAETGAHFRTPHDGRSAPEWKSRDFQSFGADRDPPLREPAMYAQGSQGGVPVGHPGEPPVPATPSQDGAIHISDERTANRASPSRTTSLAGNDGPLACEGDRPRQRPGGVTEPAPVRGPGASGERAARRAPATGGPGQRR